MSMCRRKASATTAASWSPTRAASRISSPNCKRRGIEVRKDDPNLDKLISIVKEREAQGWSYEAAEASFELLARSILGSVPEFFQVESYRTQVERRFNARRARSSRFLKPW